MNKKRKKFGRGPARNPNAKRHQTTREGRAAEPIDDKVRRAAERDRTTITTREDLPITPLAALHGRGLLSAEQYEAALYYQAVVTIWRRGMGLTEGSVQSLYARMVAGSMGQSITDNVMKPTRADLCGIEAKRLDGLLDERLRGMVRGIVMGEWFRCVWALVEGEVRYCIDDKSRQISVASGEISHENDRVLREIRDAIAVIAKAEARLKGTALAG